MTLYILLISFVLMMLGEYFLFKKDIIQPAMIFTISYVLSIFCVTVNIKKWNINYSNEAFFIILLGAIEFIAVSYIIYYIFNKKVRYKYNKERISDENKNYNIPKIITIILIIYNIVALTILVYNVLRISTSFEEYQSFSQALNIYKQHTSYTKDSELPNYVTILIKPIIATAYIYIFFFIKEIIYNENKRKIQILLKKWYYLIPPVIYVCQKISESNRGSIINFILSAITMYFIVWNIKHDWKKNIKIRNLFKLGIIGVIGLVIFYFSTTLVGRVNSKGIVDYITCYCGGSIECFNLYIKDGKGSPELKGYQTFGRTIKDLNKLNIINTDVKDTDTYEFRYNKDNMVGNVYTSYRRWIQDYGILGIIILQFILALIFNTFYNIIKFNNFSTRINDYLIIIYSYLIYVIYMHPIDSLFYLETFTIATFGVFLVITLMFFALTSYKRKSIVNKKKKVKNVIKILYITPALNICGGIESYCMNYYRNLNKNIKVNFITHNIEDDTYKKEIENNGNIVYSMLPFKIRRLTENIKQIKDFFKEHNDYDIIHCNMANAAIFYFYYAKKNNIKTRILHSHQDNYADTFTHKIRNIPLIYFGNKLATDRFACSKSAGDFLFKNKKYYIIKNAIDLNKYKFNSDVRKKIREEEKLLDNLVIGNIGRLTEQKNQIRLLEIMNEIIKIKNNVKLIIIGDGHLKQTLLETVKKYNMEDKVIFTGSINNVSEYLQAMDIFILPSVYEGLGIVNIEAQASGMPIIVSDKIPKEAKVTELLQYISLDKDDSYWAHSIINTELNNDRKNIKYLEKIKQNGYDIRDEGKKISELYFKLYYKNSGEEIYD